MTDALPPQIPSTEQAHLGLSLQEKALASDMLTNSLVGSAVIGFTMEGNTRVHRSTEFKDNDFSLLVERFKEDPKDVLATAREGLFAIARDDRLDARSRVDRVGRYLDAYTMLNIRLDKTAFPDDPEGVVHTGTPEYLPDGFVDMGSDGELAPDKRTREMIVLDKAEVLTKYREELLQIFLDRNIMGMNSDDKKRAMARALALSVYQNMPYAFDKNGKPADKLGGDIIKLSEMSEGVCRHQALTFQTLAQAVGLTSRLFKNKVSSAGTGQDTNFSIPERHVANIVRINGEWVILDVTGPDRILLNGNEVWGTGELI